MKRLVLLGGGHAHVEVLRSFAAEPAAGCEIVLVSPEARQLYSGMVPGFIAGYYTLDDCAIDLVALSQRAAGAFRRTAASLVDPTRREVTLADGAALDYDVLSIDIGARTFTGKATGVERHAVPVRPLEIAVQGWERVRGRAAGGEVRSITMVGGGAAGVELALSMQRRLKDELGEGAPHLRVVTDTAQPLAESASGARARLTRLMGERGIGVHCGSAVSEVGASFVRLESGIEFASEATFWSAGAAAPDLIRDSGFATDDRGFLLTNDFLQSVSHGEVFGAGDCATQRGRERPKAGVFAVRAGPMLAANLRAALAGTPLRAHVTGRRYLALVSAGSSYAVGVWNGFSWEGRWAWKWKDRIDRGFVARYR
jgi:selenide,water dikinase